MFVKKVVAMLMALSTIFAAVGFVGCSDGENSTGKLIRKPREEYDYQQEYNYDFYSREKLTIKILAPIETASYSDTENFVPQIEEATNTDLQIEWVDWSVYTDRVSATIAEAKRDQSKMPDLIMRYSGSELIEDEAAYPLYDLLMQYAPDYVDKAIKIDDKFAQMTDVESNEIYFMYGLREAKCSSSYLVREDWLKNIKDKTPELANIYDKVVNKKEQLTWNEFKIMLKGFQDYDANGNGNPNDEIPFSVSGEANLKKLRYAFGINSMYYFATENGEYKPTVYHSQYQNYLEELQELYSSGLLDNKYFERQNQDFTRLMTDNTLGCTIHYAAVANTATRDARTNGYTNTKWIGMKPVLGPDGVSSGIDSAGGFNGTSAMISSLVSEEKAIELVRFLNWFYADDRGVEMLNWGIEGTHFEKTETADGKVAHSYKMDFWNNYTGSLSGETGLTQKNVKNLGLWHNSLPYYITNESYFAVASGGFDFDNLPELNQLYIGALGVTASGEESYNFITNTPTLLTTEWKANGLSLETAFNSFESKAIIGESGYYGNDMLSKLEELKKSYKTAYDQGKEAYNSMG